MIFINKINTIILQVVKKNCIQGEFMIMVQLMAIGPCQFLISFSLFTWDILESKTKIHKCPAIPPAAHTF